MLILEGVLLAIGGGIAALAGLTGLARIRRLRRGGRTAWATVVPAPRGGDEPEREWAARMSLRFALADGQVIERPSGRRAAGRPALDFGQKVLVWYDPAHPGDVLTYGREGRRSDWVFLAAGLALIVAGAVIASLHG